MAVLFVTTIDPQLQLAITQVIDLADKIGGVSAAVLTLSIALLRDIVRQPGTTDRMLASTVWVGYLVAIICGIWTRMAVIGSLVSAPLTNIDANVRIPAGAQIVFFIGSTAAFIVLAQRGLRRVAEAPAAAK